MVKLISKNSNHMWSQSINITDSRTERRTDGQTTCDHNTALCTKVHRAVKTILLLTTLSMTVLVYLHSFSCCCLRKLRNPAKFTENSNLYSSRSSKVIDLGVNRKRICNFLLVINSNFGRTGISYSFRNIDAFSFQIACFPHPTVV